MVKKNTEIITKRHSGKRVKQAHPESVPGQARTTSGQARMTHIAKTRSGFEIPVLNLKGEKINSMAVPKEITEIKVSPVLLAQAARVFLTRQRKGTASTKTRAEVSGGGRKPWKEKGTGRARQGSIRAPHWRGGGIVFGPKPRDYNLGLPKKMKKAVLQIAWAKLFKNNKVRLITDFSPLTGKTKEIQKLVEKKEKTIIIDNEKQAKVKQAVRNLPNACFKIFSQVNIFDLLSCEKVLLTKSAFLKLNEEEPKKETKI